VIKVTSFHKFVDPESFQPKAAVSLELDFEYNDCQNEDQFLGEQFRKAVDEYQARQKPFVEEDFANALNNRFNELFPNMFKPALRMDMPVDIFRNGVGEQVATAARTKAYALQFKYNSETGISDDDIDYIVWSLAKEMSDEIRRNPDFDVCPYKVIIPSGLYYDPAIGTTVIRFKARYGLLAK
jgi:hypothetical protein